MLNQGTLQATWEMKICNEEELWIQFADAITKLLFSFLFLCLHLAKLIHQIKAQHINFFIMYYNINIRWGGDGVCFLFWGRFPDMCDNASRLLIALEVIWLRRKSFFAANKMWHLTWGMWSFYQCWQADGLSIHSRINQSSRAVFLRHWYL